MRKAVTAVALAAIVFSSGSATAAPAADVRCQAGKNDAAGKYAACTAAAEKNFILTGNATKYGALLANCEAKMLVNWGKLEAAAALAGTSCPSTGDQAPIGNFVDACVQSIADAVGGGTLGLDPVACATALSACDGDLSTCDGSLTTCGGNLDACNGSLTTCGDSLAACSGDLATSNGNLVTCNGNLATCDGNLTTCSGNLSETAADLAVCNEDLGICDTNYANSAAMVSAVLDGTASSSNVLTGRTFSSADGIGLTGSMPNNGGVTLIPTTAHQAIAAGYHDGTGVCGGDADLTAANIKSGVNLFGVDGSMRVSQPLTTGQTICYDLATNGDLGTWSEAPCPGTGQDGELQKGAARSFTDNADGTVTDNVTGLMWEKLGRDGSIHDWWDNNQYAWADTFTKIATLNLQMFAGHGDWRLPNISELLTLVNHSVYNPATFSAFNTNCVPGCTILACSCTASVPLWSSSTTVRRPTAGWGVDFYEGITWTVDKAQNPNTVRAVRGGS